jgi:hypothetical protein
MTVLLALTPACQGRAALFDAAVDALERAAGKPEPAVVAECRDICSACPATVRDACLAGALARRERHGVWAGRTAAELAEIEAATWLLEPPAGRVASRSCYGSGCDHDDCKRLNAKYVDERRHVTEAEKLVVPHKPNDRHRRCEGQIGLEGL